MQNEVSFDGNRYRRRVAWAVTAIIIFIVVYLLLLAVVVTAAGLIVWIAWELVKAKPNWITIGLAIAGVLIGVFLIYVMVRFLFESEKQDESHLMEISESEEPQLYALIAETAAAAGAKMPKEIFLSGEVNASVFIRPTVWGLILPTGKRMVVGLGLMEALSVTELKAVLAHEFGHFSQRSMRVGAYVYQVNRILYGILVQKQYEVDFVQQAGEAWWVFGMAASVADMTMSAVRWVLSKIYALVNLSHLALAREMEFHADMVAAQVTGYEALSRALMRLHLANYAEGALLDFYGRKVSASIRTANLYPQLREVIRFMGAENKMEFVGELPLVQDAQMAKFNRSKLVVNNQWESHPSTEDRIVALSQYKAVIGENHPEPSATLLRNPKRWQEAATTRIFQHVQFTKPQTSLTTQEFLAEMRKEYEANLFDPVYNGYYDEKAPIEFDPEEALLEKAPLATVEELFSDQIVEDMYQWFALDGDIEVLKKIAEPATRIRTFDYEGVRYRKRDARSLLERLEAASNSLQKLYRENDVSIFQLAYSRAERLGRGDQFKKAYVDFFALVKLAEDQNKVGQALQDSGQFIAERTEVETIHERMKQLKGYEAAFKSILKDLRNAEALQPHLDEEQRKSLDTYLAKDHRYFVGSSYDNAALSIMWDALMLYFFLVLKQVDVTRRRLMSLQAEFLKAA